MPFSRLAVEEKSLRGQLARLTSAYRVALQVSTVAAEGKAHPQYKAKAAQVARRLQQSVELVEGAVLVLQGRDDEPRQGD